MKCKETIGLLLEKLYGSVQRNYTFDIGTHPDDFRHLPVYGKLNEIFTLLQNRGVADFVKARKLAPCDYFVPDPGFVIEFDESQHFTVPRRVTLENYPDDLVLGFDRETWIQMCKKTRARDNSPPYRDEQRAWYDVLRDFLPEIRGLKPTVRLFAGAFEWCSLDPERAEDVAKFRRIIRTGKLYKLDIAPALGTEPVTNPLIARIIICSDWKGRVEEARDILGQVYSHWPKGTRARFLLTCGGFLKFEWPRDLVRIAGADIWSPDEKVLARLISEAEKCVVRVLDDGLCDRLSELVDYITVGIDAYSPGTSTTQRRTRQLHVELVALVDLKNRTYHWTGKSYPTTSEEMKIIRVVDLEKHFVSLEIGNVMILGCHDLKMYDPRSKPKNEWRKKTKDVFRRLAMQKKPVLVLHHPHTTVKFRTWLNAWKCLERELPSVRGYAGAGRYYEDNRVPSEYDRLEDVLVKTRKGNTIDIVVRPEYPV